MRTRNRPHIYSLFLHSAYQNFPRVGSTIFINFLLQSITLCLFAVFNVLDFSVILL